MERYEIPAEAFQGILFDAINRGDLNKVKQTLGPFSPEDLDRLNNDYGHTFLTHACALGNIGIVKALIEAGAGVNTIDQQGEYPLGCAAWDGNVELVQMLLDNGADPDLDLGNHPEGTELDEWVRPGHPNYDQIQHRREFLRAREKRSRLRKLARPHAQGKAHPGLGKM